MFAVSYIKFLEHEYKVEGGCSVQDEGWGSGVNIMYMRRYKKNWFSAVEQPILKLGSPNFRWSFVFS